MLLGKGLEFNPIVRYNRGQTLTDFVKFGNKHKWKYIFTANESRDNKYHPFSLESSKELPLAVKSIEN